MAAPTKAELEVVKKFRAKVSDLGLENATDLYMLRWLRARDLSIPASEDLLRKHLQWRKAEDLDNILEWVPPENFKKDYFYQITGSDNEGHPILIIPFGEWDVRKIMTSGKPGMREAWLRHIDQIFAKLFERMEEMTVKYGHEVTQCVFIVDFAGFSMRQLTSFANVSTILEAVKRFEANYPEILFQFYFINAFRVFQMFFALMKPLLSPRTVGKLEIYTSPDKWLPVLTSRLPKDQLPKELGGMQPGRRVSTGSALTLDTAHLDEGEMACVEISAGEICKLDFPVVTPKSILSWNFKLEAHDIGFSVRLGETELIEAKRYDASGGLVTGTLTCDIAGDYMLNFDNSYSRMRGKTVFYTAEVIEPEMSEKSG